MALFPSGVKPSYLEEPVSEVKYVCEAALSVSLPRRKDKTLRTWFSRRRSTSAALLSAIASALADSRRLAVSLASCSFSRRNSSLTFALCSVSARSWAWHCKIERQNTFLFKSREKAGSRASERARGDEKGTVGLGRLKVGVR